MTSKYEEVQDETGVAKAMRKSAYKHTKTPKGGYHAPKKGKGYKRHEKHKGKTDCKDPNKNETV